MKTPSLPRELEAVELKARASLPACVPALPDLESANPEPVTPAKPVKGEQMGFREGS